MEKTVTIKNVQATEADLREALKQFEKPKYLSGEVFSFAAQEGDLWCKLQVLPQWETSYTNIKLRLFCGSPFADDQSPPVCNRKDLLKLSDMLKEIAAEMPV